MTPTAPSTLLAAPRWTNPLHRLVPLWRHGVWALSLFAVLAASTAIRLDVQQMRKDLDRNARAQREAQIQNDRLRLELDARRRAAHMEQVAAALALSSDATVVRLAGGQQ